MSGPDVRWEGVPHEQILTWVNEGPGPSLTERMEARLKSAAETLAETSDLVNTTLQRVNGGEWTGTAANAAAAAMQVLRDFDDTMRHRSTVSDITAFGQSDSAGWARTSVPPAVEVGPGPAPAGRPEDVLRNIDDYQDQQLARKEAEQRARQVMREYTAMTTDRVRSMPLLAPAPQVVLDVGEPGLAAAEDGPRGGGAPGPAGSGGVEQGGPGAGGGGTGAGGGGTGTGGGGAGHAGSGGRMAGEPSGPMLSAAEEQVPPPATTTPAVAPRAVGSGSAAGVAQVGGAPEAAGGVVPLGAVAGPLGSASPGGGNGGGGRPGIGGGEPRIRASEPGARTAQQSPHARGTTGPTGVAPVGASGPRDDRERQARYIVPSSAIFEPDEDVPPPTIGAEDD